MIVSEHSYTADIAPIPVLVKKDYLMNFEGGQGTYAKGSLVALWAYPGHMPTFTVLLEDGSIFSYLPAAAFVVRPVSCHEGLGPVQTSRVNCPSENFILYTTKMLTDHVVLCYSHEKEYLGVGKYFFSMEWPNENEVVHFVQVGSHYHFIPNHKMLVFPKTPETIPALPAWKKLREEWKYVKR